MEDFVQLPHDLYQDMREKVSSALFYYYTLSSPILKPKKKSAHWRRHMSTSAIRKARKDLKTHMKEIVSAAARGDSQKRTK